MTNSSFSWPMAKYIVFPNSKSRGLASWRNIAFFCIVIKQFLARLEKAKLCAYDMMDHLKKRECMSSSKSNEFVWVRFPYVLIGEWKPQPCMSFCNLQMKLITIIIDGHHLHSFNKSNCLI